VHKPLQFIIMLVGKTHNGKSTFGRRLSRWLPNSVLLEPDDVGRFLAEYFPQLYYRRCLPARSCRYPTLKFKLYLTILRFALNCGRNVTVTSNNIQLQRRAQIRAIARRYRAKVIMVFFNLPDSVLLSRIRRTKRPQQYYCESKNFEEILLKKHNLWFSRPTRAEADRFYVVRKASNLPAIERKLKALIRTWGYRVR